MRIYSHTMRACLLPVTLFCLAVLPQAVSPAQELMITEFMAANHFGIQDQDGDFSDWTPLAMQRRVDGWWFLQVSLTHGHHQYRFLIDGRPQLDPRAAGVTRNAVNEEVSVIAVS